MDISTIITSVIALIGTILAGSIALIGSVIVCVINNLVQMSKIKAENEKSIALIQYQLSQSSKQVEDLTAEVKKNNEVKDRVTKLEGMFMLFDKELEAIKSRLDRTDD